MINIKKLALISTLVLTIGVTAVPAFAATENLTTTEDKSLEEIKKERLELRKEILALKVEEGLITQEQADEFIKQMEENQLTCDGNREDRMNKRLGGKGSGRMGRNCRFAEQN